MEQICIVHSCTFVKKGLVFIHVFVWRSCLACRDIGSSGRVGDDMNWMEIQTLSLCFIVSIVKKDAILFGQVVIRLYESVSDPFVKHSYENAVVGRETKLLQYVFCAVFDI